MYCYHIPIPTQNKIPTIPRGSRTVDIPPSLEIPNININGHVRNLSDWLAICDMTIEDLAIQITPGVAVATALGFTRVKLTPPRNRRRLATLPPRLRDIAARSRKLSRHITYHIRAHREITQILCDIIFKTGYDSWRRRLDFSLPPPTRYYPHLEAMDDLVSQHRYATAIRLLIDYGYICKLIDSDRYFVTELGARDLYTDRIWSIGAREQASWYETYKRDIDKEAIYNMQEVLTKSPGYEAFRRQCKRLKIRYPRSLTGSQVLSLLCRIDAAIDA